MIFPTDTVAPSIKTIFIDSIKFDICEVIKDCYNLLDKPTSRFFVCVEDSTIIGYQFAEKYFKTTKDCRWGLFCKTKKECLVLITEFENCHNKILEHSNKITGSSTSKIYGELIQNIQKRCINIYGIYPHI